jgi:hypothetical protein
MKSINYAFDPDDLAHREKTGSHTDHNRHSRALTFRVVVDKAKSSVQPQGFARRFRGESSPPASAELGRAPSPFGEIDVDMTTHGI